jgi:hypothetical protein
MIQAVDNIGVYVKDLERAVSFCQKLGFTKTFENNRGVTMVTGTARLFVFQSRKPHPAGVNRQFTLVDNPPRIDHISFVVEDIDRVYSGSGHNRVIFYSNVLHAVFI